MKRNPAVKRFDYTYAYWTSQVSKKALATFAQRDVTWKLVANSKERLKWKFIEVFIKQRSFPNTIKLIDEPLKALFRSEIPLWGKLSIQCFCSIFVPAFQASCPLYLSTLICTHTFSSSLIQSLSFSKSSWVKYSCLVFSLFVVHFIKGKDKKTADPSSHDYVVVDKSKKKKKETDENAYAIVDKSKKSKKVGIGHVLYPLTFIVNYKILWLHDQCSFSLCVFTTATCSFHHY